MKRWTRRIGLVVAVFVALALVAGVGYEQLMRWSAGRNFPPQGRLVDIGGRRMQIDCRGAGSPTVVFESGLDVGGSLSWSAAHTAIATTTRACAYSRAGIMWSDGRPGVFVPVHVAEDLHATLAAAGERPPFVLVGHSLGGPYIMIFTSMYPSEVAGLVFVDTSHPNELARIAAAAGKPLPMPADDLSLANTLRWTGLSRLLFGHADPGSIPSAVYRTETAFIDRSLPAVFMEAQALRATLAEAGRCRDLGDRPLIVLSARKPLPEEFLQSAGIPKENGAAMLEAVQLMHDDEARWSRHSRHILVSDAGHYIQFDRPDVVIAAVRDVVGQVRAMAESAAAASPASGAP